MRKEGNAHEKYNAFRSAFEILETIGEPITDELDTAYRRPMSLAKQVAQIQQQMQIQQQQIVDLQQRVQELEAQGMQHGGSARG